VTEAAALDVVEVKAGTYSQALDRDITIAKDLTVKGESGHVVTLDAGSAASHFKVASAVKVSFENLVLRSGSATNGGSISLSGAANVILIGCTLKDNAATSNGGAVYMASSSNLTVLASRFESNTALLGGAVAVADNATLYVSSHSTFEANSAENGGGLSAQGAYASLFDSTFKQNAVHSSSVLNLAEGGGMVISSDAVIQRCVFDGNTVTSKKNSYGGAISHNSHSQLQITESTFARNEALFGGAVSLKHSVKVTVKDSAFDGNRARDTLNLDSVRSEGAALYTSKFAAPVISGSNFTNGTAHSGAVVGATVSSKPTFSACNFSSNTAGWLSGGGGPTAGSPGGGVVYAIGEAVVSFDQCTMKNNTAVKGGFANMNLASITVSASLFSGHQGSESGGVFFLGQINTLTVQSSHFWDNSAGTNVGGGVLYGEKLGSPKFYDCTFRGNTALHGMGAVAMVYHPVVPIFERCKFSQNTAKLSGGAMALVGTSGSLKDCTFIDNRVTLASAGGGSLFLSLGSTVNVTGGTFSQHTWWRGAAVWSCVHHANQQPEVYSMLLQEQHWFAHDLLAFCRSWPLSRRQRIPSCNWLHLLTQYSSTWERWCSRHWQAKWCDHRHLTLHWQQSNDRRRGAGETSGRCQYAAHYWLHLCSKYGKNCRRHAHRLQRQVPNLTVHFHR
jgi:hypothetical protein